MIDELGRIGIDTGGHWIMMRELREHRKSFGIDRMKTGISTSDSGKEQNKLKLGG
jgi:hypothetical protein